MGTGNSVVVVVVVVVGGETWNSTQWRRMSWSMADRVSITSSTATVSAAHMAKPAHTTAPAAQPASISSDVMSTRSQNTSDSPACASESAQSRKYDAVLDTDLRAEGGGGAAR